MSLGLSIIRLKFFCSEYTVRTRRICQFVSLFDTATIIVLAVRFSKLINEARIDDVVFDFGTLAACVIQFITAAASFFFITRWGNLKFVPYHQSAKLTFVVCFVLERIAKDLVECYALNLESSKCNSIVSATIGNVIFTLVEIYLIYILRMVRLKWLEAISQAFRRYLQPDQEQTMDGVAVEVCGYKYEEDSETNIAEDIAQSYKFTIDESASPCKIKVKDQDSAPEIIVFDEVNLMQQIESNQNKKFDESNITLGSLLSYSPQKKLSKSEDEEISEKSALKA